MNYEIADALTRFFDGKARHRENITKTQSAVDERKHPLRAKVQARCANVDVSDSRRNTAVVQP